MKSFQEFRLISEGRTREEAERLRKGKMNPADWYLDNIGTVEDPSWQVKMKPQAKRDNKTGTKASGSSEKRRQADSDPIQNRSDSPIQQGWLNTGGLSSS